MIYFGGLYYILVLICISLFSATWHVASVISNAKFTHHSYLQHTCSGCTLRPVNLLLCFSPERVFLFSSSSLESLYVAASYSSHRWHGALKENLMYAS